MYCYTNCTWKSLHDKEWYVCTFVLGNLIMLYALSSVAEYNISGLSPEEYSIGTSVWPLKQRKGRPGKVKLNKYQKQAIGLACNNQFTMIQGPPGDV